MKIRNLSNEEVTLRTASLLRRTKGELLQLLQVLGLQADAKKITKPQIIALLLADAGSIEPPPKVFNMAGLSAPRLSVCWPMEVQP